MKQNILIVDDEKNLTQSLAEGLKSYEEKWEVFTASNGKEALSILQQHTIDLVVTDLKMPVMDGFELLSEMSKKFPEIPVIVMSAHANQEIIASLEKFGIDMFLDKTFDIDTFYKKIKTVFESVAYGFVRGINLVSFLQLISLEKKTCTVTVNKSDKSAKIYFKNGELMDAETGDLKGVEAILEILPWENCMLEIQNRCKIQAKKIPYDLNHLILEAMRIADEKKKKEEKKKNNNTQ